MSPSLLHDSEDASGLHHIISTSVILFDFGGISLLEDGDGVSVFSLDGAVELAVGGIILEPCDSIVDHVVEVIDGDDTHFARVKSSCGDQAPSMAKSIYLFQGLAGASLKTGACINRRS